MTRDEQAEWRLIYETRLGILCEDRDPTPAQVKIARDEANRSVPKKELALGTHV